MVSAIAFEKGYDVEDADVVAVALKWLWSRIAVAEVADVEFEGF